VTPCHNDINNPNVGDVYASTELDVALELQGSTTEEDDGIILSYQASTGPARTFVVPMIYGLTPKG